MNLLSLELNKDGFKVTIEHPVNANCLGLPNFRESHARTVVKVDRRM